MADPPPEEPAGHPLAAGSSPQPLQPAGQPPAAGSSPQPLSELDPNGECHSDMKAAPMKAASLRSSLMAPHRKIKRKKSSVKTHPYSKLMHEEVDDVRENMDPRDLLSLGLEEVTPKVGIATMAQPLQSIASMDVQFDEREEDDIDSDEEEEEFDLDSYQATEKSRAELADLMERYGVYDEEQLRLAVRRERK